jgi:hypothetical protein
MGRGGGQSLNISCLANPPPATRRFFSVMTSFADHRETDLFGQPVRPNKGRRGRPALQVTNEGRDMLEMACARGWPNARIAEAVGISVPSLKRHFRSRPVQPPRPRRWRGKLAPRSELRRPVPGSGAGGWPADPVRCNRPVRGAGAGSWHPDPSFADLSRGLARAAGRPIPSGATAPSEALAREAGTPIRASQTCPGSWRGRPDRGASFPRQRLFERGASRFRQMAAHRDVTGASPGDLTPRFADGGCPGRAGGTNRRLSGGRPGLRNCFICVVFFRVAHRGGFEPPTPRFVVWCSIQLSYRCPWRSHIHRRRAMQSRPRS